MTISKDGKECKKTVMPGWGRKIFTRVLPLIFVVYWITQFEWVGL